jgi:hypothetical protein
VLAAGVLPDTTDLLTKTQYAGVNVLFAIILVMSGFLFDALRKRNGYGRAWVYFICVFMIFTAVFGELLTLFLLIADSAAAFASAALTWTLRAFAVLALVLVFGYGIRSIDEAYQAGIRMVRVRHRPPVRGSLSEIFRMRAAFGDIEELSIVEPGEPGDEAKEPSPPTAETDVPLSWVMP